MVGSRMKVAALVGAAAVTAVGFVSETRAALVAGVSLQGFLVTWDSATPDNILSGRAIGGLQANEHIIGLDFRPGTGTLYGLGSFNHIYTLDMSTGTATAVGGGMFTPALNGNNFGFGFNPMNDQIRVTSNADQNLRINPDTLAVSNDAVIRGAAGDEGAGANPNLVHLTYTNVAAGSSTFFGVDVGRDTLVTMADPNSGQITTVGALGFNATEYGGIDIGPDDVAYGAFLDQTLSASKFYRVNLTNGTTTEVGTIGGGSIITSMAVIPAPASLALLGLGVMTFRRRR